MCFFLISLETSSLTHGLMRSVLFSFQVLGDFSCSLFLISSWIPFWSENILCMISILLYFIGVCFMTWDTVYIGECYVCTWKVSTYNATEVSNYNCEFIHFSIQLCCFASCTLKLCCLLHTHLRLLCLLGGLNFGIIM